MPKKTKKTKTVKDWLNINPKGLLGGVSKRQKALDKAAGITPKRKKKK